MRFSTFPAINNVQIIEIFVGMLHRENDHYKIQNTFQIIVKENKYYEFQQSKNSVH